MTARLARRFALAVFLLWHPFIARAETLEFFLSATGDPGEDVGEAPREDGTEVRFVRPAFASVQPRDVARANIVAKPILGDPETSGRRPVGTLYEVRLILSGSRGEEAGRRFQEQCRVGASIIVVLDQTVVDQVPILGCGNPFKATRVLFDSKKAEEFAREFTNEVAFSREGWEGLEQDPPLPDGQRPI